VVEPLTDEWLAALTAATKGLALPDALPPDTRLVVEYRVDDGPSWHLVVAGGSIHMAAGPTDDPDATYQTDRATALALAAGTVDPLQAVIDGDLTIRGDPRALVAARALIDGLGDPFASLGTGF